MASKRLTLAVSAVARFYPAEAVQAHLDLGAMQSIAMHFGTFQLSAEGMDQPRIDLHEALRQHHVSSDTFITLEEGETRVYRHE